jgi:hypothetical protein
MIRIVVHKSETSKMFPKNYCRGFTIKGPVLRAHKLSTFHSQTVSSKPENVSYSAAWREPLNLHTRTGNAFRLALRLDEHFFLTF